MASASDRNGMRRDERQGRSFKAPITRARTGCFTCRRRKKKCDERKPSCANCQKSALICEGYPAEVYWQPRLAGSTAYSSWDPMVVSEQILASMAESDISSPQTMSEEARVITEATSNAAEPVQQGSSATAWQNPVPFDTNLDFLELDYRDAVDRFHRTTGEPVEEFGSDSHLSLSNCTGQRVTSTDQRLSSSSRNIVENQHKVGVRRDSSLTARRTTRGGLSLPMELPFLLNGVDTYLRRRLFGHFTEVVSTILTLSKGKSNPLNSVVVPLALKDSSTLDAMLCMAASHLLKLDRDIAEDEELIEEKNKLYDSAVDAQSALMRTLQDSAALEASYDRDSILATALLLCLYELCEGTGDDAWLIHLDAARRILRSASSSNDDEGEQCTSPTSSSLESVSPFLVEYFIYHDTIASVTVPMEPVLEPSFYRSSQPCEDESYMVGVYDGLAGFISQISDLRARWQASAKVDGNLVCEAVEIWQELSDWESVALDGDRQLIALLYRGVLFIWLYSIIYPDGQGNSKVQNIVKSSLADMQRISPDSGGKSCLLFPLFIVGAASISNEDREAVSMQFEALGSWSALGNVSLAHKTVKNMWNDHDSGVPRSWDWMRHLQTCHTSLLVT